MTGAGRVFRRGSRWWIAFYDNGVEHRESLGPTVVSERQARRCLALRITSVAKGEWTPSTERLTGAEVLQRWVAHLEVKGSKSLRPIRSDARRLEREFGACAMDQITPARVEAWVRRELEAGSSRATMNKLVGQLRAALRLEYRRRRQLSLAPTLARVKGERVRQGFFERGEFERIVAGLRPPIDDVAQFAYRTGWRLQEILGLQWAQVDRSNGVIRLADSKNNEGRVIPIVEGLAEVLDRRWSMRVLGCPFVFHRDGRPVRSIQSEWERARAAVGLSHKLFHDFRRTAARDLVDAGFDPFTAMQITGHRSLAVFQRYRIVDVRRMAEALQGMEARRRARGSNVVPIQAAASRKADTGRTIDL